MTRPTMDESALLAEIARFTQPLCHGSPHFVDKLVQRYGQDQALFQSSGYSVWPKMGKHPLAAGLFAYRQLLTSGGLDADLLDPLLALAEVAVGANMFVADWLGFEGWLAPRLRHPEQCENTVFVFQVGLYLRNLGYEVEYLEAKRQNQLGPDLLVHIGEGIHVECVRAAADGGHRVHLTPAREIAVQLLQYMEKTGNYSIVLLQASANLESADTHALIRTIKGYLEAGTTGQLVCLNGSYRVEILSGGSAERPVPASQRNALRAHLDGYRLRWGISKPASELVRTGASVVGGVGIASVQKDDALKHLAEIALSKRRQLPSDKPSIVVAGFGPLVDHQQVGAPNVLATLGHLTSARLRQKPEISAIGYLFRSGWNAARVGAFGATAHNALSTVHVIKNVNPLAKSLPVEFRWTNG